MKTRSALIPIVALVALAPSVFAHEAGPADFDELRYWWAFDPGVVVPLALSAVLYAIGVTRLRRVNTHAIGAIEISCFVAGWLTLVIALVSPLHPLGSVLFSAHMTQHELLMLVAAPLLVLGRPLIPFLWAFPKTTARRLNRLTKIRWWHRIWRTISAPLVAWSIHAVVLWGWHVPALFDATLESEWVHALQHASFFGSALLFWWAILHGRSRAVGYGAAVLYMFTTALHSSLLGALLTFAPQVWYPVYNGTTQSWGLTPLEDQQLGGLIMWIPAGLVYIVTGLALFAGWLRESERRAVTSAVSAATTQRVIRPDSTALRTAHLTTLKIASLAVLTSVLISCGPPDNRQEWAREVTQGDPQHGRRAMQKYGCISCHTIDGISSESLVGPPLTRMAGRSYIAGSMPNSPANIIHFIEHPRKMRTDGAMPEMGVTNQDARDMAAYLYQFQ
jgi:putative membrane protein